MELSKIEAQINKNSNDTLIFIYQTYFQYKPFWKYVLNKLTFQQGFYDTSKQYLKNLDFWVHITLIITQLYYYECKWQFSIKWHLIVCWQT